MAYGTNVKSYCTSKTSGSAQTVLTPTSGKKLIIGHITMQNGTASLMKAFVGTDGVTTRLLWVDAAAGGGQSKDFKTPRAFGVDEVLKIDSSAGTAYICIEYEEE